MFEVFSKRNGNGQKSDVLSYDSLPQQLKVQTIYIWNEVIIKLPAFIIHRGRGANQIYSDIQQAICKEQGVFKLTNNTNIPEEDVCNYFLRENDLGKCLDVIELVFNYMSQAAMTDGYYDCMNHLFKAVDEINLRFKEHSIGYEFVEGKFIRIDSSFLHSETVSPAMVLLSDKYLTGANQEFFKAHDHFRHGRFPEAINECLKAFESTMKSICHKQRWHYNQTDTAKKLLAICEENGLFPAYMQSSLSGLRSVLETVATVRNKLSGHGQGVHQIQVTEETAAFMIHSTAANILYLASLEKRLN